MGILFSVAAIGAGMVIGVSVGHYLLEAVATPESFEHLDESMDSRDDVPCPEDTTRVKVERGMHDLLKHADAWASFPDFDRVYMISRVIRVMWPMLQKGILAIILRHVPTPLNNRVFNKKLICCEDILIGNRSMRDVPDDYGALTKDRRFDFGTAAPRLGGIKVYSGIEDEAVLEANFIWASNCKFDLGAMFRVGPFRLWVPLHISRLCVRSNMRVTFRPLVERLPCLGGIKLNMLGQPTLSFGLKIGGLLDVMAVPILGTYLYSIAHRVLQRLFIYPNCLSFQINRPDYGQLPAPKGALQVRLLRADNVRYSGDTYVEMWIRKDRPVRSKTVRDTSSPTYDEEFCLIVDDFVTQKLDIRIMDDTLGWNDVILGYGSVAFSSSFVTELANGAVAQDDERDRADFIQAPATWWLVDVELLKPLAKNITLKVAHHATTVAKLGANALPWGTSSKAGKLSSNGESPLAQRVASTASASSSVSQATSGAVCESRYGKVYLEVMFIPFRTSAPPRPLVPPAPGQRVFARVNPRNIITSVVPELQGVLTITLVRCMHLVAPKKGRDLKVYVRFTATDETSAVVQTSRIVLHELSPRWGDKLDFVRVKASAVLQVAVFNRVGMLGSILKLGQKDSGENDVPMGRVKVTVADVVRNGRLRNTFTLQDTERGSIELVLQWTTIHDNQQDRDGAL